MALESASLSDLIYCKQFASPDLVLTLQYESTAGAAVDIQIPRSWYLPPQNAADPAVLDEDIVTNWRAIPEAARLKSGARMFRSRSGLLSSRVAPAPCAFQ